MKPSNIVLADFDNQSDYVKVVDFGVAKLLGGNQEVQRLTQAGDVTGSPVYMSPEQCVGDDLDRRSDIYSMGVVLYEALTGSLPLCGRTMVDTMSKHIREMPKKFSEVRPDLQIPEKLESVVFTSLAKDPNHRQQSMLQLAQELRDVLDQLHPRTELQEASVSAMINQKSDEPFISRRAFVLISVAATVGVLAVLAFSFLRLLSTTQATPPTLSSPALPAATQTQLGSGAVRSISAPVVSAMSSKLSVAASPARQAIISKTKSDPKLPPPLQISDHKQTKRSAQIVRPARSVTSKSVPPSAKTRVVPQSASDTDPFSELRSKHSWAH